MLEDGTLIRARTVLCNADPKVALRLLDGQDVPDDYRARLEAWKVRSPVVKFNAALTRAARSGPPRPASAGPRSATIDVTDGLEDAQRAFEALRPRRAAPSASARSTSRPATTRRPRPRAATC